MDRWPVQPVDIPRGEFHARGGLALAFRGHLFSLCPRGGIVSPVYICPIMSGAARVHLFPRANTLARARSLPPYAARERERARERGLRSHLSFSGSPSPHLADAGGGEVARVLSIRVSRDDSRPRERRIAVFQRAGNCAREVRAAHYEIGDITGGSCIPGGLMGARFA